MPVLEPLGNVTLQPWDPLGSVPLDTSLAPFFPELVPDPSVAKPDENGVYRTDGGSGDIFLTVPYVLDDPSRGFQDTVLVEGFAEDPFRYALSLTTLRLGDGDDVFRVVNGANIRQALSSNVSKDESLGYVFQSNIFAGAGNDRVAPLMPWQSVFKGGTNTPYYDGVFGSSPGGGAVSVVLGDDLTLEELEFGDRIELKGSRFDWDIEFRDGNSDGEVTLESILDERDYLAFSNNNQISGFEQIRFGDIFFDLILARQQDSSAVFGQPDYYLNGLEDVAPELNSSIIQNSGLWEAFRFNRTSLSGIIGLETQPIVVYTGNAADTPFLVGALRFASLFTEGGADRVDIDTVDRASIDLGTGLDFLKVGGVVSRSTIAAGDSADSLVLKDLNAATVLAGDGDDVVELLGNSIDSIIDGGVGTADALRLPGTLGSYLFAESNAGGLAGFTDRSGNVYRGFETYKFSDVTKTDAELRAGLATTQPPAAGSGQASVKLTGSRKVDEGAAAKYSVALDAEGLSAGASLNLTLDTVSGTAKEGKDFAQLVARNLKAETGLALGDVTTASTGRISFSLTNTLARDLVTGESLISFAVRTRDDSISEPNENFKVVFNSRTASVTAGEVKTTITDNDSPAGGGGGGGEEPGFVPTVSPGSVSTDPGAILRPFRGSQTLINRFTNQINKAGKRRKSVGRFSSKSLALSRADAPVSPDHRFADVSLATGSADFSFGKGQNLDASILDFNFAASSLLS